MALYTLSEFMKTVKEDVGLTDIPLPVTEKELLDRFDRSVLRPFSVYCPRIETCRVNESNIISRSGSANGGYCLYEIPKYVYEGTIILDVAACDPLSQDGYSDIYIPNINITSPMGLITGMMDVQAVSTMYSAVQKAVSHQFEKPNRVRIYHGYYSGIYELRLLLKHDISLATISEDAFPALMELAVLDLKAYLYNKLKRKDGLEVGVGTINLKIDDWSGAEQERKELLKNWDEEGANLDFEDPRWF